MCVLQSFPIRDAVRDCLEKDPSERTDDDIEILMDFMQHFRVRCIFSVMSTEPSSSAAPLPPQKKKKKREGFISEREDWQKYGGFFFAFVYLSSFSQLLSFLCLLFFHHQLLE